MSDNPLFLSAGPYQDDVLALPVDDLDKAAAFYGSGFGMTEVSRAAEPVPTVILERDGVQIGFAIIGGGASNDGAAVAVTDLARARQQLESNGIAAGETQDDKRDGKQFKAFFVVAPDGLCYYFYEEVG